METPSLAIAWPWFRKSSSSPKPFYIKNKHTTVVTSTSLLPKSASSQAAVQKH